MLYQSGQCDFYANQPRAVHAQWSPRKATYRCWEGLPGWPGNCPSSRKLDQPKGVAKFLGLGLLATCHPSLCEVTGTDTTSGSGHLVTDGRCGRGGRQKTRRGDLRGVLGGDPGEKGQREELHQTEDRLTRERADRRRAGGASAPQPRRALSRRDRLGLATFSCGHVLLTERSHSGKQPRCLFSVSEPRVFCQISPTRDWLRPKGIPTHLSWCRHF